MCDSGTKVVCSEIAILKIPNQSVGFKQSHRRQRPPLGYPAGLDTFFTAWTIPNIRGVKQTSLTLSNKGSYSHFPRS